jgi:hypothetical protein
MTAAMDPTRRLKIQFNLGLLLICAGAGAEVFGGKWPGLALLAAGAAVYFPASRRRKAALPATDRPQPVRNFWGVIAAILVGTSLGPLVLPRMDTGVTWRMVLPVSLAAAVALIGIFYWKSRRRPGPR